MPEMTYPSYYKNARSLLVYISSKEMYKIQQVGSNSNEGVCIDHYITRRAVLKYRPGYGAQKLRAHEMRDLLRKLFGAYIDRMIMYGD